MRLTRIAVLCLMFTPSALTGQAEDPYAFWQRQMNGFERALRDPGINQRVYRIWTQLVSSSGQMYPVWPAQRNNLGQALPNGVILLDLSVAGDDDESVTAFWLAHEYAHQVLGHPRLSVTMLGQFIVAQGGTRFEDDADRWAARFLARNRYEVEPVLDFLCSLPGGGTSGVHSPGPVRSANVAATFGRGTESRCTTDVAPGRSLAAGTDSCKYAGDGQCDEPDLCARGTDSTDCRRSTTRPPVRLGSACYTSVGACPLISPYPVGQTCTCYFALGAVAGRVQN